LDSLALLGLLGLLSLPLQRRLVSHSREYGLRSNDVNR